MLYCAHINSTQTYTPFIASANLQTIRKQLIYTAEPARHAGLFNSKLCNNAEATARAQNSHVSRRKLVAAANTQQSSWQIHLHKEANIRQLQSRLFLIERAALSTIGGLFRATPCTSAADTAETTRRRGSYRASICCTRYVPTCSDGRPLVVLESFRNWRRRRGDRSFIARLQSLYSEHNSLQPTLLTHIRADCWR